MYKMLIVEDEFIEREALRDLIDWNSMGIEIAKAVECGEDALVYAVENKVDILFTDIKLMEMTGLELARKLLRLYPELKVVVTSGYHEFDYAREAVDLNAVSFISKPIELDELKRVMQKAVAISSEEDRDRLEKHRLKELVKKSMPYLKDRFFTDLIMGFCNEKDIAENLNYFNIQLTPGYMVVMLSEIDNFRNVIEKKTWDDVQVLVLRVLESIQSVPASVGLHTFYMQDGRFCTVLNMKAADEKELHDKTFTYSRAIQRKVNERVQLDIQLDITIGIGNHVTKPSDLNQSYKKACDAIAFKFYMGNNQIIYCGDVNPEYRSFGTVNMEELEKKILTSVELCNIDNMNQTIDLMFSLIEERNCSDNYVRNVCSNLLAKTSVFLLEMNEGFDKVFGDESLLWNKMLKYDTIKDIKTWMKNIFSAVIQYLGEKRNKYNKKVIHDIMAYIEKNYHMNITIADISKEVYMSPNYISIIFKKEVGESFTDFLIKFRLEKAREMLKNPSNKIYQVGSAVGYSNISYFCSIFKKHFGVSPNEFREKI